jgi:hypothetical protein
MTTGRAEGNATKAWIAQLPMFFFPAFQRWADLDSPFLNASFLSRVRRPKQSHQTNAKATKPHIPSLTIQLSSFFLFLVSDFFY